jgi:TolB-like protein
VSSRNNRRSCRSTPRHEALGLLWRFCPFSSRFLHSVRGITDEITHNLTRNDGIRVIARASLPEGVNTSQEIPALSQKLAVNNIIEGTVREDFDRLRITVRVLGADGFQVSSHRFETIADAESLIRVQEQIATAFISRARPEQSRIRQRKAMPRGLMIGVYRSSYTRRVFWTRGRQQICRLLY